MKKILCPIDFTDSAKQGMEYASRLSKAIGASLSLLYVRPTIWPEAVQLKHEEKESNESITTWLGIFSKAIHEEFGVTCDYHFKETTNTPDHAIADVAKKYDLIIMGSNGVDNSYQYVFGSQSFQLMKHTNCPVILVPEGYAYKPITGIVYAYDPHTNPLFLTEQLRKLAEPLQAAVKVLHILEEKPSVETMRKMEILEGVIKSREHGNVQWSFEFQSAEDVALALNHYMNVNGGGDMLALSFHHRSIVDKLFRENVIEKIAMIADYPVFTFWH